MFGANDTKFSRHRGARFSRNSVAGNVRITWMLVSLAICLMFVVQRTTYYFSVPVTTDTAIIPEDTVRFPPVILCPYGFDTSNFYALIRNEVKKQCESDKDYCKGVTDKDLEDYPLANISFSAEIVWRTFGIDANLVDAEAYKPFLKRTRKMQADVAPVKREVTAITGNCVEITLDEAFYYHGYYTYLNINVKQRANTVFQNTAPEKTDDIWLYIPNNKPYSHLDMFYSVRPVPKNCQVEFQLTTQEFKTLNLNSRPCTDENSVLGCKKNCLQKKLDEAVHCKLPFSEKNQTVCSTMNEIITAYQTSTAIYDSMSTGKCNCPKICKHTVHTSIASMEQTEITNSSYATSFSLRFANGFRAVTTENYLYPLSALISDIGGNIGFFLGLSVWTSLEYITDVVVVLFKKRMVTVGLAKQHSKKSLHSHHTRTEIAWVTKH